MIVKNERDVIERSLRAVKPYIDSWVIVDTGSTDGTQELIRRVLRDVPGELHERPWVDFAHNRNEALRLAEGKAEYLLFIDADDELVVSQPWGRLTKDYYIVMQRLQTGALTRDSGRILLVKESLGWEWVGVVHEALQSAKAKNGEVLEGVVERYWQEGQRSRDPQKFRKDALALERALVKEPANSRYVFYLAESYQGAGERELAAEAYRRRAGMGGSEEEVFWSLFCGATISTRDLLSYSAAHLYRPSRAEPLYEMASDCIAKKRYLLGVLIAEYASCLPLSKDAVFVEHWIYEWGSLLQLAECLLRLGKKNEAGRVVQQLLTRSVPGEIRAQLLAI